MLCKTNGHREEHFTDEIHITLGLSWEGNDFEALAVGRNNTKNGTKTSTRLGYRTVGSRKRMWLECLLPLQMLEGNTTHKCFCWGGKYKILAHCELLLIASRMDECSTANMYERRRSWYETRFTFDVSWREKQVYECHGFLRELMHGSEKRRMKYPFQVSISMSELAAILRFKGRLAERWTSCDAN